MPDNFLQTNWLVSELCLIHMLWNVTFCNFSKFWGASSVYTQFLHYKDVNQKKPLVSSPRCASGPCGACWHLKTPRGPGDSPGQARSSRRVPLARDVWLRGDALCERHSHAPPPPDGVGGAECWGAVTGGACCHSSVYVLQAVSRLRDRGTEECVRDLH